MSEKEEFLEALEPVLNWLKTHFNMHRFLWLLAVISFMVAWNRGLALLYGLFALILAVLALSYLYPFLFLRNVSVRREPKTIVKAGEKIKMEYRLTAPRQLIHIELIETLPFNFSAPLFHYFISVVNREYVLSVSIPCELRGEFVLDSCAIESSYPFGIFTQSKKITANKARVLVLPKTFPIKNLPLALSSTQSRGGNIVSTAIGIQDQFSGLREYRYGDSLKHVHWAATARHQELIVKEYESIDRPTILVVLDQHAESNIGELPDTTFEYVVQITASIIEYAIENRIGVYVFGKGKQTTSFSVMPGSQLSREFLERLALVKADGEEDYLQVVQEAVGKWQEVNTVISFCNRSGNRAGAVNALLNHNMSHIDIEMIDESFIYPIRKYHHDKALQHGNRLSWSVSRITKLERLFE